MSDKCKVCGHGDDSACLDEDGHMTIGCWARKATASKRELARLTSELARKDRIIEALLPLAVADWCPPGPCKGLRSAAPTTDCRACVLAWAETEADREVPPCER